MTKEKINQYTISILIFTITLFGGLSFFINKDTIDSWINYYIIFSSGIAIMILILNNLEDFKLKNIKKVPFFLTILTLLWMVLSFFFGIRMNLESVKGLMNFGTLLITGFVITNIHLSSVTRKAIFRSIYLSFALCMLLGIFQYFSGINLIQYSNALYPGILGRINSTFFIATILDKYIVLISVLLAYHIIKNPNKKIYKFLYILGGIGISLTFSRGGLLVFAFITFLLFLVSLLKKQVRNVVVTILTALIVLLIPGSSLSFQSGLDYVYQKLSLPNVLRVDITFFNDFSNNIIKDFKESSGGGQPVEELPEPIENQSVAYREKYKSIGKQFIKEYPIFGIGPGNYSYLYNNQNFDEYLSDTSVLKDVSHYMYPHSGYIQAAAEIGVIGLILLCATLISYIFYVDYKKDKLLFFTIIIFIASMFLACYTEGVFHSKQYIFVFMILLGFLCSRKKEKEENTILKDLFQKIYKKSKQEFLQELETNVKENERQFIVTANPEAFMLAQRNETYHNLLLDKEIDIVPDGIGLVKAGNLLNYEITERITGVEIAETLLKYSNQYEKSVYLFGAKEEVIQAMQKMMKEKYPKAKIVGAKNGYEKDKDAVFQDIIKKKPDVVLVALGMPLQEQLIYQYFKKAKNGIFVGVGGSFDVLSGMKKRAPEIWIKLNLEWFYRIIKEPKRFKRFYNNNIKFMFKVLDEENEDI